jgi:hypothetical protein
MKFNLREFLLSVDWDRIFVRQFITPIPLFCRQNDSIDRKFSSLNLQLFIFTVMNSTPMNIQNDFLTL